MPLITACIQKACFFCNLVYEQAQDNLTKQQLVKGDASGSFQMNEGINEKATNFLFFSSTLTPYFAVTRTRIFTVVNLRRYLQYQNVQCLLQCAGSC